MKRRLVFVLCIVVLIGLMIIAGCFDSRPADPRSAVIAVFGAMEKNDKAALAHLLDLSELMSNYNEDYALKTENPRKFTNPEQILEDMTGDGDTKRSWFSMQRIVNNAEVIGETATVEVTFVDKQASRGYRTKFGLHFVNNRWKVYSFKTTPSSN